MTTSTKRLGSSNLQGSASTFLAGVLRSANLTSSLYEALYGIAKKVTTTTGYKGTAIWSLDSATKIPLIEVAHGLGADYGETANRAIQRFTTGYRFYARDCIEERHLVCLQDALQPSGYAVVPDEQRELMHRLAERAGYRTAIYMPLLTRKSLIGAMACYVSTVHFFSKMEIDSIRALAQQAAVLIDLLRHNEEGKRLAAMQERERIAGELHDWVVQDIAATSFRLEETLDFMETDPVKTGQMINSTLDNLSAIQTNIRSYAHCLQREGLSGFYLGDVIRQVVQEFSAISTACVRIDIDDRAGGRLSRDEMYNLVSITREVLTNVHKHARAHNVSIVFGPFQRTLALRIEDDGVGFEQCEEVYERGMGLKSIRSRVRHVGGYLEILSGSNVGTTFIVRLPPRYSRREQQDARASATLLS